MLMHWHTGIVLQLPNASVLFCELGTNIQKISPMSCKKFTVGSLPPRKFYCLGFLRQLKVIANLSVLSKIPHWDFVVGNSYYKSNWEVKLHEYFSFLTQQTIKTFSQVNGAAKLRNFLKPKMCAQPSLFSSIFH